jgi:hypothetical protein
MLRRARSLGLLAMVAIGASGCGLRLGSPKQTDSTAMNSQVSQANARIADIAWGQRYILNRGDFGADWSNTRPDQLRTGESVTEAAIFTCLGVPIPADTLSALETTTSLGKAKPKATTTAQTLPSAIQAQGVSNVYFRSDLAYVISTSVVASTVPDAERIFAVAAKPDFGQCVAKDSDQPDQNSITPPTAPTSAPTAIQPLADDVAMYTVTYTQTARAQAVPFTADVVVIRYTRAFGVLVTAHPVAAGPIARDALAIAIAKRMAEQAPPGG